jgi:predicted helicase
VFNLRGNQRTSGELSRKEGGKIFGSGSRTPISITILVRKPNHTGSAAIHYEAVADYLSREEKLALVRERGSMLSDKMNLSSIAPNEAGDWINQRDGLFETFIGLAPEKKYDIKSSTVFVINSRGLETSRDSIAYSSSLSDLRSNIRDMISRYNKQREEFHSVKNKVKDLLSFIHDEDARIIWTRGTKRNCENNVAYTFDESSIRTGVYRPFFKQHTYVSAQANEYVNHWLRFFPTPQSKNLVICVPGVGTKKGFMPFIVDTIPDVQLQFNGQCFPLYYYEKNDMDALSLFDNVKDDFVRRDAITDFILQRAREEYGPRTTKEDVFYYVYGILHAKEYRERFAADLQKSLPRLPLVEDTKTFRAFVSAGKKLAVLHLNYESIEPYPSVIIENDSDAPKVMQMRFGKSNGEEDKSIIHFNDAIRIINIPLRAYDWQVNGKSPIEWVMERYAVTVNKDSQIRNDPNEWCKEIKQPRYILELIVRIVNVSIQTLDLIAALPPLSFKTSAN